MNQVVNTNQAVIRNQAMLLVLFLLLGAISAYLFGAEMRSSNPDGIWLYAPPVDGSGSPSDAFSVGSSIGVLLISLIYLALAVTLYSWAKLKSISLSRAFSPLIMSSIVGFVVIAILGEFAI